MAISAFMMMQQQILVGSEGEMKDRLAKIRTRHPHEIISLLVDGIERNSDTSDLHTIRRMSWLSQWLFILADKEDALYFADIVSKLDLTLYIKKIKGFTDAPAIAHHYQGCALVLCTTICKETGDSEKANAYWNRYLVSRLETNKWGEPCGGTVARKRWKRNLEKGDLIELRSSKRQSYIASGRKAFYESMSLLEELLWMKEAGGSELFPVDRLREMTEDVVDYLRINIDAAEKDYIKFHIR